ncbi:glycosyltransferase [Companilactobacillus versmoldensis]|uniref:Family 2 glycosyl transferase n=1 Tax=Companilactobacillus versmoldensis DSM 14857 = KCTC 3814 TaxID=1423815 RepID=A0A0R1SKR2_9LACO|nr:glycosyltransferase [Companilactobacillus versmoldensis]KRL66627.1 family 2 glycosyl transferase [Companilactobacillus versmoldensis DSM 14857 = KCTC 3814]
MNKITAISPVYNVEKYLRKAVESLIEQTVENLEIILVDDGSTDNSGEICDALSLEFADIQVIHQPNSGAAIARNTGIKASNGKYLYFMDPDDWMEPTMLENMFIEAEINSAELVITGFTNEYFINDEHFEIKNLSKNSKYLNQNEFRENAYKYFNNTYMAVPWNKLYLSKYIKEHNLEFPNVGWDDLHFNMEVIKDISRVCITDDTGYHFLRSRPGSETTKVFDNSLFHKRREQFIHILGIYNYWGNA